MNINTNDSNEYKKINDIFILANNCSVFYTKFNIIRNSKDYKDYMNYLSCKCKGLGYWGGFCLNKKLIMERKNIEDKNLSNELANLFRDKTVVDLGAGLGKYCNTISMKSSICDEYDGSIGIEEETKGRVKYLNLAEPILFDSNYDSIISIEYNVLK